MGTACSSLGEFWHKPDFLDLLIVVDEYDCIKICMNGLKSVLATTKFHRIKHCSIFDLANEKQKLKCQKVLFLVVGTESKHHVETWIRDLPNIRGNVNKYLIMCLHEGESNVNLDVNEMLNVRTYGVKDTTSWFPQVLYFLYESSTTDVNRTAAPLSLITQESDTSRFAAFQTQMKDCLQKLGISFEDLDHTGKTFVYICNSLEEPLDVDVKARLRQEKIDGHTVYVIANSYRNSISDDIKWISTQAYTRDDTMLFLLHIMASLGLIRTKEVFVTPQKISKMKLKSPIVGVKFVLHVVSSPPSNRLVITCLKYTRPNFTEYICIQHRTNANKQWKTENMAKRGNCYIMAGLDASCRHQVQLKWVEEGVECEPVCSKWFTCDVENTENESKKEIHTLFW